MATSHMLVRGAGYDKTKLNAPAFYVGVVGATGFRGTAALPVFSWEEDPSTGVYSSAASIINFTLAGVEQFRIANVTTGTITTAIRNYTATLSPAAVAANTSAEQTFTVTGLATTDTVYVNKPTAQAGLGIVGFRVSAVDTLAITFGNFTGLSITPTASEVYRIVAIRSTA